MRGGYIGIPNGGHICTGIFHVTFYTLLVQWLARHFSSRYCSETHPYFQTYLLSQPNAVADGSHKADVTPKKVYCSFICLSEHAQSFEHLTCKETSSKCMSGLPRLSRPSHWYPSELRASIIANLHKPCILTSEATIASSHTQLVPSKF